MVLVIGMALSTADDNEQDTVQGSTSVILISSRSTDINTTYTSGYAPLVSSPIPATKSSKITALAGVWTALVPGRIGYAVAGLTSVL